MHPIVLRNMSPCLYTSLPTYTSGLKMVTVGYGDSPPGPADGDVSTGKLGTLTKVDLGSCESFLAAQPEPLHAYSEGHGQDPRKDEQVEMELQPRSTAGAEEGQVEMELQPRSTAGAEEGQVEMELQPRSTAGAEEGQVEMELQPRSTAGAEEGQVEMELQPRSTAGAEEGQVEMELQPRSTAGAEEGQVEMELQPRSTAGAEEEPYPLPGARSRVVEPEDEELEGAEEEAVLPTGSPTTPFTPQPTSLTERC